MPSWFIRFRDVVWSAVFSVVLSVAAVVVALIFPDAIALPIALGSSAIVSALLAQRV
jgi:hypothetical protein